LLCGSVGGVMKSISSGETNKTKTIKSSNKSIAQRLDWIYLQYLLTTGLYLVEPWERGLFNSLLIAFLSFTFGLVYYGVSWIWTV